MSQIQVVRGQTRASVLRKIQPLLAQGWVVQGAIAQETGWVNSVRYAATLVFNPPVDPPPATPAIPAPAGPDPALTWAIGEIQKLQAHCRSLEARLSQLEARDPAAQPPT